MLNAETICAHDHTHTVSIVLKTHVNPCRMSCNS
jgi:hypothetical protein